MKIIIIGASGTVGRAVAQELNQPALSERRRFYYAD